MLREMVETDPHIREEQRIGRALFWDHSLDWEEQRRFQESSVKQKPYVYDPELTPRNGPLVPPGRH